MNEHMKEAFEVGALAQELVALSRQATEKDIVRLKAITLTFVVTCATRGVSVDDMCDLVREIAEEAKRGATIKETAQ